MRFRGKGLKFEYVKSLAVYGIIVDSVVHSLLGYVCIEGLEEM